MNSDFPILLVEDDNISQRRIGRTLLSAGYEVMAVENGRDALELFRRHAFPIVLTDWLMPEMDGLELCRAIRALSSPDYVFIVFLTTNDSRENIIRGLEAGADDYLTKPFDPVELIARLASGRRILELERAMRQANEKLRASLNFQKTLMDTLPNPVFYTDAFGAYLGCNAAWADDIVGLPREEIVGRTAADLPDLIPPDMAKGFQRPDAEPSRKTGVSVRESRIRCADGVWRDFIRNQAAFKNPGGGIGGIISVMMDITEKNRLLRTQEINIDLAKNIMGLINAVPERHTPLPGGLSLFTETVSLPCNAEGGDHFFVRNYPDREGGTAVSLKDQSGHEVGCILRSIITDLLHNALLSCCDTVHAETAMSRLNDEICQTALFSGRDFFTAIHAEIRHSDLEMRFLSAGHPPLLLIRGTEVTEMPRPGGAGSNPPLAVAGGLDYSAASYRLRSGDRLIFYTDGLIEMPWRKRGQIAGIRELKAIVARIVADDPQLPVCEIVRRLLKRFSAISGQTVIPPDHEDGPRNTSPDDVTVIGMEIERRDRHTGRVFRPESLKSVSRGIIELYREIGEIWRRNGFAEPERRLRVILEEALLNAWKHGNREQGHRAITVRWHCGNDFVLEVTDEGDGFDHTRPYDPTCAENVPRPCGRGLFFIRELSDCVAWEKGGSHLRITFRRYPMTKEKKRRMKEVGKLMDIWRCERTS
ncbi:hypothetical protein DENIS_4024 [Desulfonema ishimotonii]|uniref:Histidine kinase n=1 Tax=Desulfonema ishimotonii TaxID=45657 RepID=A0A401G1F1_9BACT|nr:response regulator [Desulfonema ishimotonii]GBC63035.1 hypothetical protein DENIS_4024 [Desulfonema ishimotonii]